MQLSHLVRMPDHKAQGMLVLLLLSSSFLLSACGGHPRVRQEANSAQTRFTQVLQHAQQIGVPTTSLRQILQQQQQLLARSAPFNLFDPFNDQAADDYYRNLATRYTQLTAQVQVVITSSTAQARKQTLQDLQSLQHTLQRRQAQDFPVQKLSEGLVQAQAALPQARVPLDYTRISGKVHDIQQSLTLMVNLSSALASLNQSIALLQQAHLDVTDLMMSYQKDKEAVGKESTLAGFTLLQARVHAQTQQALTSMVQVIPALVTAKISAFSQQLQLMQKAKIDISLYK